MAQNQYVHKKSFFHLRRNLNGVAVKSWQEKDFVYYVCMYALFKVCI